MSNPELGNIIVIPMSKIVLDKKSNIRSHYGEIDELAESIKRDGQLTPIMVEPAEDGKFKVVFGFRRVMAMRKLKNPSIRAELRNNLSRADRDWLNAAENLHRRNLSPYEIGLCFLRQKKEHRWSGKTISERFGSHVKDSKSQLSVSYINNLIRIHEALTPFCLKEFEKGRITFNVAITLASLKKEEQDDALPEFRGKAGKELKEALKRVMNPDQPPPAPPVDEESPPPKRSSTSIKRPNLVVLDRAIKWCEENDYDEAMAALRWAAGVTKTMTLDGGRFDPERTVLASDEEDGE